MFFTKELDVAIQAFLELINSRLILLNIFVHEAHVEVDGGDVGVVFSAGQFEDLEGSAHVFEGSGPGTYCVVVEGEGCVGVGVHWWVEAKHFLLQNDDFSLKFDGL